jgi:hypothetical protein
MGLKDKIEVRRVRNDIFLVNLVRWLKNEKNIYDNKTRWQKNINNKF